MPKITIRNLDTEINRRIKLIKTPTSSVNIGEQSGAVSEQSDSVHICLSPFEKQEISCVGATSQLVFSSAQPVAPVEYERWEFKILDPVSDDIFTRFTNLDWQEGEEIADLCEKGRTPACPFDFSFDSGTFANTVLNSSAGDVRLRLIFAELVDDGEELTIEFFIDPSSTTTYQWITQIEGEYYELVACLASA